MPQATALEKLVQRFENGLHRDSPLVHHRPMLHARSRLALVAATTPLALAALAGHPALADGGLPTPLPY